ncbi:MAG: hypothetical protein AAFV53_03595 [Myxococcota bacterium]
MTRDYLIAGVELIGACLKGAMSGYVVCMPPRSQKQHLTETAETCRRSWQALLPERRARLLAHLTADPDIWSQRWAVALSEGHPMRRWLDSDEDFKVLPVAFEDDLSPRQLITSHPFRGPFRSSPPRPFPASLPRSLFS